VLATRDERVKGGEGRTESWRSWNPCRECAIWGFSARDKP